MQIRQIGEYKNDILETVLANRGIEDIDLFLNPTFDLEIDNRLIKHITEGIKMLEKHLTEGNKILLIVDSDADGVTSSSYTYSYLKNQYVDADIQYVFHSEKKHGFTKEMMSKIKEFKPQMVLCIDGGTNDIEEIEEINDMGIDVLIIDHHEIDRKTDKCVLINNQIENCENKDLTGVGMAYVFCCEMDKYMKTKFAQKQIDLVMLGLIGDMADLRNNDIRYICHKAKTNIKNKFILKALKDRKIDLKTLSYTDLSFYVIPLINATCRMGTIEEKDRLFKALANIDTEYTEIVTKRKLNKTTRKYEMKDIVFDIYDLAIDGCKEAKKRQDKVATRFMKEMQIDKNQGIIVALSTESVFGLTGLIAGKIATEYQKPTLILQKLRSCLGGSGRGYTKTLGSLKDWCEKTNMFDLVQGHSNAHGIELNPKNFNKLRQKAYDFKGEEFIHEVDYIYKERINKYDIDILDCNRNIFGGNTVQDPIFAVINLSVLKSDVKLQGKSTLKIEHEGVTYIKYKSSQEEYMKIVQGFSTHIEFNFICRVENNYYKGKKYPQAIVSDMEYKPTDVIDLYF